MKTDYGAKVKSILAKNRKPLSSVSPPSGSPKKGYWGGGRGGGFDPERRNFDLGNIAVSPNLFRPGGFFSGSDSNLDLGDAPRNFLSGNMFGGFNSTQPPGWSFGGPTRSPAQYWRNDNMYGWVPHPYPVNPTPDFRNIVAGDRHQPAKKTA